MQFYQSIFGGELEVMHIKDAPDKERFPKEIHHQIMHASLKNGDFFLMASDMCGQGSLDQGNSMQLSLNCSSEEEINKLYQKLSEGGKIIQELNEVFWGGLFAMVRISLVLDGCCHWKINNQYSNHKISCSLPRTSYESLSTI